MRERRNQITLAGHPGGGKTTAAKLLATEMGWEYFNVGAVHRQLAAEMGMSTLEFNGLLEQQPELNHKVDAAFDGLNKSGQPMIVDARLGWHFMPHSFKVKFEVPIEVGAQRVFEYARRQDEQYRDFDSAKTALAARRTSERKHYMSAYKVDVEMPDNFDLILDTAHSLPERNVSFVRAAFSLWYKGIRLPRDWSSPKSLLPTGVLDSLDDISAIEADIRARGFDMLQPVSVGIHDERLYIVDGHKRVLAAQRAGCDFLPVTMVADATGITSDPTPLAAWKRLLSA